jgi:hypothetical protein
MSMPPTVSTVILTPEVVFRVTQLLNWISDLRACRADISAALTVARAEGSATTRHLWSSLDHLDNILHDWEAWEQWMVETGVIVQF